jgi:hypothetical protein
MSTAGVEGRLTRRFHKLVEYIAFSTDRVIRSTTSSAASRRVDNASACFGRSEKYYLIQLVSSRSQTTMASPRGDEVGVHDGGATSAKATDLEETWRMHEVRDEVSKLHVYILMDPP